MGGIISRLQSLEPRPDTLDSITAQSHALIATVQGIRKKTAVTISGFCEEYNSVLGQYREGIEVLRKINENIDAVRFLDLPHLFHGRYHFILNKEFLYVKEGDNDALVLLPPCSHQDLILRRTSLFWIEEKRTLLAISPLEMMIVVRRFRFNAGLRLMEVSPCCEKIAYTYRVLLGSQRCCEDKKTSEETGMFTVIIYSNENREEALSLQINADEEGPAILKYEQTPFAALQQTGYPIAFFNRDNEKWMLVLPEEMMSSNEHVRLELKREREVTDWEGNKRRCVEVIKAYTKWSSPELIHRSEQALHAFRKKHLRRRLYTGQQAYVQDDLIWVTEMRSELGSLKLLLHSTSFCFVVEFANIATVRKTDSACEFVSSLRMTELTTTGKQQFYYNRNTNTVQAVQYHNCNTPKNSYLPAQTLCRRGVAAGVTVSLAELPLFLRGTMSSRRAEAEAIQRRLSSLRTTYQPWKAAISEAKLSHFTCGALVEVLKEDLAKKNKVSMIKDCWKIREELAQHLDDMALLRKCCAVSLSRQTSIDTVSCIDVDEVFHVDDLEQLP